MKTGKTMRKWRPRRAEAAITKKAGMDSKPSELDIVRAFARERGQLARQGHVSALTRSAPYNLCS
jgi:hypothetical protein